MSQTLFKTDVTSILSQWKAGLLTNAQVHDWAIERCASHAWDPENGAVNEVLGCLDMMNLNLVIVEDVPVFLAALGEETADAAAQVMDAYQDTVDFAARKRMLVDEPLYAAFCK